jgi:hypothetical protein
MDFWGNTFTNNKLYSYYSLIGARLALHQSDGNLTAYLKSGLLIDLYAWEAEVLRNFKVAYVVTIKNWTPAISEGVYSTGKWHMVKVWEMMQQYDLEGKSTVYFGNGRLTELRTWNSAGAFNTSPKALLIPERVTGVGGSALTQHYFADAWYQLQLTLNPGNGQMNATHPIDWPYNYGVIDHSAMLTKTPTAIRMLAFMVKAMQETDNGLPPSKSETGWSPQGTDGIYVIAHDYSLWNGIPFSTEGALLTALLGAWLDKTSSVPVSEYYAAGIASASQVPNQKPDVEVFGSQARWIDEVAWMIPIFRADGADNALCNSVCNWAQTVWPNFNWSSLTYTP